MAASHSAALTGRGAGSTRSLRSGGCGNRLRLEVAVRGGLPRTVPSRFRGRTNNDTHCWATRVAGGLGRQYRAIGNLGICPEQLPRPAALPPTSLASAIRTSRSRRNTACKNARPRCLGSPKRTLRGAAQPWAERASGCSSPGRSALEMNSASIGWHITSSPVSCAILCTSLLRSSLP